MAARSRTWSQHMLVTLSPANTAVRAGHCCAHVGVCSRSTRGLSVSKGVPRPAGQRSHKEQATATQPITVNTRLPQTGILSVELTEIGGMHSLDTPAGAHSDQCTGRHYLSNGQGPEARETGLEEVRLPCVSGAIPWAGTLDHRQEGAAPASIWSPSCHVTICLSTFLHGGGAKVNSSSC